ncbi:TPA: MucBP domain-containing protein [Streptococcus suis]|nr:MucBP domain-containing protein [Streptococcus suis]HEM3945931.1 MucBP domain-containing protein [Streptococcus suis]HEM3959933.1 MucBP domain-containing protein [Streptococcus suis]HEP1789931.1 MucBP domain-containing protein [Streptococcus suis]HEP1826206.1 MucBP domain-containing protein [Streptococcus suis]
MKKNKKFVKLGIKLMASTVLVGCVATIQLPFDVLSQNNIIYAEDTNNQPISVLIGAISEADGPLSQYYVTISPGETKTVTAPEVDGYKLDQYTEPTYELTYDYASRLVNSGGTAWVLFWMEKDTVNSETPPKSEEQNNPSEETPIQFTVSHYETLDDSGRNLKMLDTTTYTLKPGEYVDVVAKEFPGYRLVDGMTARVYYEDIIKLDGPYWEFLYVLDSVEEPTNGNNSTDTNTVNYTIQLVDQDGQVLQTIQQSGVEGTEVSFDFPVISGYRVGKTEGFDSWIYGKGGTFRLVANQTVKVYYDKAPSIDSLIRPEQRVEYQKVFDTFHTTVLKAFEVYKKELGVDHIIRLSEDEAKFNQITQSEDLTTLELELILVENLFDEPVGLVLTDQDIINAIGWTPEYWDYQIAYHKEITQKLEKAMANIAASEVEPTVPVDQPITIKVVYRETQIEPGQKITPFKEETFTITPGESVTLAPKTFDGWKLVVGSEQTVTYEQAKRENSYYFEYVMDSGNTQGDNPVDIPTEQPVGQPISVTFRFVDTEGNIIHQDISWSVSNGGTPAINEAPAIDGYELVDPTQAEMLVTYEQAKENGVYIIKYTKKITPPSEKPNGSTVTPPSDNSKGSTVTAPKDKEKDSTSNSNISVGGDKQPTDNKKTEQLAVDKKEKAATSATDSKKEEKSSSDTKTLPNTGQATSASEITGFMMLGLAGLAFAIKKRRRNG